jgi:hypothetical protein
MFFGRVSPGAPVSAKTLDLWIKARPLARRFTDPNNSSNQLGVNILGQHADRTVETMTTTVNLKWFADGFIVPSPQFPATSLGKTPFPFVLEGMDVPPSFVMPMENAYASHLVVV